jgi:hypothetical protein
MRKFLISAALMASTVAVAAPAAAQWAPPQPQGYAYGYNNNYGQVRRLQVRIDQIQRQIVQLDRRNILSNREAGRLRAESRSLEQRLRYVGRNGLNGRERYDIERRIARLEQHVYREARDGNNWRNDRYGNNGYGYNYDRDRDGLDDRYERDRGTNYDEDRDPD